MSEIFLQIINMSISASYIVLAVILLRLLLRKAPKWISVLLWGIVAVRLVCPFSIESVLSLIPSAEVVSPNIMTDKIPDINTGIPIINITLNPVISGSFTPGPGASVNPLQVWIPVLAVIWIVGMTALLVYTVISYAKVRRKIGAAVLLRDNIYQSEKVVSPFVLGIIKPKIYLPFGMNDKDTEHVVAHEMAHIRRKDHLWKPLGFLLLTIHWFNPLMWLGYLLLCRDIELACDEKVVGKLDHDARADYSEALLTCSVNRRMIAACPLAFGEVGVKNRVKSVLNYKKPAFWIIIAAVVACVVVAICFLTNPKTESDVKNPWKDNVNQVHTEYEGVYITLASRSAGVTASTRFHVLWNNETDEKITYGESYSVEYKYGDGWKSVATEEKFFHSNGIFLKPNSIANKIYSLDGFDISKRGEYRLVSSFFVEENGELKEYNTWIEFEMQPPSSDYDFRRDYPEYFDLDASNGLDVYVWQASKNGFYFGLLEHSETPRDPYSEELFNLKGTYAGNMSVILGSYSIDPDKIYVIPWQNPFSSYISDYWKIPEGEDKEEFQAAYIENIRSKITYAVMEFPDYDNINYIYDMEIFDVDGDGKDEICEIGFGWSSGIFTFRLTVREIGKNEVEYDTWMYSKPYVFNFVKGDDGSVKVRGVYCNDASVIDYFDIETVGRYVILTENSIPIGDYHEWTWTH